MAGEKRTQDQEETLLSETVILVDIEGTTTSISFVKDTLFPYVRENLKKYIETKWEDEEFKKDLEKLKEQAKKDEQDKIDGFVPITGANTEEEKESVIKNVLWQMDGDRKTGALKQLQGHIWRDAYDSGAVKAHIYEDVPKALESWTNDGRKVYVYSSGSIEAQKLLFGHSVHGDLLKYFSGYFDTEVGAKQESSSYKNILSKIGVEASSVIFLTDVVKEAQAAKEAGLSTAVVIREGNAALTDEERVAFTTIKSLLDLTFQTTTKRQKLETVDTQENVKKSASDVSEPMDTSEDVEMSDVSEKKVEKIEAKEVVEAEAEADKNAKVQKEGSKSTKTEEPMVTDTKDAPSAEKIMETEAAEKAQTKVPEVSTKLDTESVQPVSDNKESKLPIPESVTDKSTISEKVDKPLEQAEKATESASSKASPAVKEPVDGTCESKSKSDQVSITEKKTDEPTDMKETKSEDKTPTDVKTVEEGGKDKDVSSSVEGKSEECVKSNKEEVKEQSTEKAATNSSTIESPKSESAETPAKSKQEPPKVEEKPAAADVTENGDVPVKNVEKVAAPTITEPEATSSKADTKAEVKDATEKIVETKSEKESETADQKSCKPKEADEPASTINDKEKQETSAEASKQESTKESVKEETVVDEVKDKNIVDSEKKKLNGTTQNGDTELPVSDDKLHRNGLNEGSSNEKLNKATNENTSAQNGEPESSSEASAESIKVKKVVDSTVTDGAGEPDVVPPVVVAATS